MKEIQKVRPNILADRTDLANPPKFSKPEPKLLISAGHSNTDPGAVSTDGRYTEADIVLEFRNLLAAELTKLQVPFIKDGEGDVNLPLSKAIELAKTVPLAIEFHCNAFTNKSAKGVETLSANVHKPLGAKICEVIARVLDTSNRGAKGEASGQHSRLGFISRGEGIIVELFFITNDNDLQSYFDNKHKLAQELARLLQEHV